MITKNQIKKAEKELNELKDKFKLQENTDFQKIIYKNKEYRIYKWEDKPIKDFQYPKGFRIAEFQEFVDLIDNKKIELEIWKYYYVKHFSKIQQTKEYCLSGLYLDRYLDLYAYDDDLSDSNSGGRVVVVSAGVGK